MFEVLGKLLYVCTQVLVVQVVISRKLPGIMGFFKSLQLKEAVTIAMLVPYADQSQMPLDHA